MLVLFQLYQFNLIHFKQINNRQNFILLNSYKVQKQIYINFNYPNKQFQYKKFKVQKINDMNQHILSTPQNSNSLQKCLYNTTSSIIEDDCPYCLMKRKFNIGSTGDQKCFQHSIKINLQQTNQQDHVTIQEKDNHLNAQQMVQLLEDVENSLDYYWENLRQISGGNPNTVHKQLQPVLNCVKKVQQKIGKFFYDTVMDISQIKPASTHTSLHKKLPNTNSQRFLRVDLSNIFDYQEVNTTDSIKQWVMYFHKILQMRQQPQQYDPLPHQSDLQMRIFKQSMERKFLEFTQQIKLYEKKVKDSLTKLVFYMEKSSQNVSVKQIQEDILFIQGQHSVIETRQAQLERLLLMQAASMEYMLYGNGNPNNNG